MVNQAASVLLGPLLCACAMNTLFTCPSICDSLPSVRHCDCSKHQAPTSCNAIKHCFDSCPLTSLAHYICCLSLQLFILLGFHEFLPSVELLARLEGEFCKYQPAMCVNILAAICGYNPSNLDERRLATYVNYTPSGTSVKNMAHWSQVGSGLCKASWCAGRVNQRTPVLA